MALCLGRYAVRLFIPKSADKPVTKRMIAGGTGTILAVAVNCRSKKVVS